MSGRVLPGLLLALTLGLASAAPALATPTAPANFAITDAVPGAGFNTPTNIAFLPDGRFFVAEKRGRVYEVRNGIKQPNPLWSGENEVLNVNDRGLLCIAVDPNYFQNHYIYLLYTVDPDSNGTDDNAYAFGRVTRYTVNFTDSASVVASSRTILLGYNWPNGPVSASPSHTIGSLRFGRDGSLFISCGDGAEFSYVDAGGHEPGCFGSGLTSTNEDIGAFRAQDITSLAGKVLRINPATGHGYAGNPYANTNLASVQSRVWAYGVRNPFRFTVKPGTGSTDTSSASPGTIYLGDVGMNTYEEMNVVKVPGVNFGWPCYEGFLTNSGYQSASPAHNGCGSYGSSTNPQSPTAPKAAWNHDTASLSTPSGFIGNCSVGGVFYTRTQYPTQYRNQYIFADYGQNWLKLATMDSNDNLQSITSFVDNADAPVDLEIDPVSGDIFYVSITTNQVRRIRYTAAGGGNNPPIISMSASPLSGVAPLNVTFSSNGTVDPDNDPLTYAWVFGDGGGSTAPNPSHVFNSPGTFTVQLTVSDGKGGTDVEYIPITVSTSGGGFPGTPVLDGFNRANGAIGGSWTDATNGLQISSNILVQSGNVSNTTVWNGGVFGANQEAYVTFINSSTTSAEENLMLKVQGTTWSTGHIEVAYNASQTKVSVNTYSPTQGWVGRGTISSVTFNSGDTFGARADSLGNVAVFKNGTQLGVVSVSAWNFSGMGGRLGMTLTNIAGSTLDNFGGGTFVAASGNTKPTAQILAPANNSFYYTGQTVNLSGTGSDAETPSNQLTYDWNIDLYHNNHIHPETYVFSGPTASFIGQNHDDGTGVHLMVKFTATDPQGLCSDTARVVIWPEIDLRPSAVTVSPDPPTATQSATYAFKIYNTGRMPAPISHWVLRAGSTALAQGDTIVAANDSVTISRDATIASAGTYTLRAVADSANTVFETVETNNATVRSLTVSPVPGNHAPVAVASGSPQSGTAPLAVTFSGAGSSDVDNDPLTYAWSFGDGASGAGSSVGHTYTTGGNFAAVLTVSDGRGGSDTASVAVSVTAPASTFPQTAVLDDFNRANGAIGGQWVDATSGLTINTNQLAQTVATNSTVWNGATFGATQEAYLTIATAASASEQNLMLKVQGTTWSTGHIEVSYQAPNARVNVGTYAPTQGWVGRGSIPVTFASGDQFGARTDAAGNVTVYKNGNSVGTVNVGNWPFVANGGNVGLTLTAVAASRWDNFGGGTGTGAPVPQPDLQVSAVTVTPDPPTATQSAQYAFKLYNRGTANAGTSHWVLRANSTLVGQGDVAINAGDSSAVSFNASLASAGTFTLRLVADSLAAVAESNEANNVSLRSLTVNPLPGNNPPVAVAAGNPQSGTVPLAVSFTGAGSSDPDSDPLTYSWAFGDGANGSGLTAAHTYTNAGSYAAILTVTDGRGGSDTASVAIAASAPPVAFPKTAVLDNFNRASGAIGGQWVDGTSGLVINSNRLAQTGTTNSVVWNGATFGATQEAFLTIVTTTGSSVQSLMLKVQGTTWTTGHIELAYKQNAGVVTINTYTTSQGWIARGTVTVTFAAGDQFGGRADAAGNVTVYRNGVAVGSVVNVGNWPFAANGGHIGLTLTARTSARWDDFGGGTVPGTALIAELPSPLANGLAPVTQPRVLELSNAFPNPTTGAISMTLGLPEEADVSVRVLDITGRDVWHAPARRYVAGRWTLSWDGRGARGPAGSGIYLAYVRAGSKEFLRRIAIIR